MVGAIPVGAIPVGAGATLAVAALVGAEEEAIQLVARRAGSHSFCWMTTFSTAR